MRCGDRATILRYFSEEHGSELDAAQRQAVEDHLDDCLSCSRLATLIEPAAGAIRQAVATPPEARADCPNAELLSDYAHRRLPQLSRGSVKDHLLSCAACLRRVHSLSTQPGVVERRPLRPRLDRRIWLPVAVALPGYAVALLALSGRLPGVPTPPSRPAAVMVQAGAPAPPPVETPAVRHPSMRPFAPPQTAPAPERPVREQAGPAEGAPAPGVRRQVASARPNRPAARKRPAVAPVPDREPRAEIAARPPAPEPRDPLLDLALALSPTESQPELVYARELMLKDRVDDMPVALEEITSGGGPRSLALVACVALLYHANPGYDQQAVAALEAALKPDGIEADPKERALRSLQLASQLAQGRAREVMRRFQEYEKRGVEPAFETYVLAAIVLDQAGQRRDAISALRAAKEWLEEDLRARAAV